jgi:4-diphosphocytidyl-2-C-methyl-D-erythritol kinase
MRVYRINSRAKINLNLNVIRKSKKKKLHLIESLVCFVNLSDKIYINKSNSKNHKVKFIGKFSKKITKKNTVTKLLYMLDNDNALKNKYKILIKKEIPLQSGMGGGSMNAANLLNYFYKKKIINLKKLKKYSLKIGSDVILGLNSKPKILFKDGSFKEVTDIKKYLRKMRL